MPPESVSDWESRQKLAPPNPLISRNLSVAFAVQGCDGGGAVIYRRPLQLGRGVRVAIEYAIVASAAILASYLILQTR
jgi:hypothetical protein